MTTSLAALFHGPEQALELRQVPLPQPKGAEILVRVLGCTLCGSDLHTMDGRRETPVPTILGHEIVGEITAFGDTSSATDLNGEKLAVGDRVTWAIVANCGTCFYCQRGLPQKCAASVKYGHEAIRPGYELSGGFAEHCLLVAGTAIVRLPESLPLSVACPANCATATVTAALAAAGEIKDRNVCVFGVGMLGLTACAMLRAQGAANVVCVDIAESRLLRAKEFGATHAVMPGALDDIADTVTGKHGFDIVFEISGNEAAFQSGWKSLRLGGTMVLLGSVFPAPPVPMALEQIVRRNITIHGIHNYTPRDLLSAVRFLSENHERFPFADLVGAWFPLENIDAAIEKSRDAGCIRVGVGP